MSTLSEESVITKGRCFSMCEPDDLSLRDDKLMKPIVVNDGDIPTRFFLYLFPEEPKFNLSEVGEPGFLSPLIKAGKIEQARKKAAVHLNEYPQMESYAGFFNVNPKYNSHLYFWFFPSQNQPSKDPVIIWLQVIESDSNLGGLPSVFFDRFWFLLVILVYHWSSFGPILVQIWFNSQSLVQV